MISQLNHGLLHVGLELTPVMNLSGVKNTHVSHRDLYAPEGRVRRNLLHHLRFLNAHDKLMSDDSLVLPSSLFKANLREYGLFLTSLHHQRGTKNDYDGLSWQLLRWWSGCPSDLP